MKFASESIYIFSSLLFTTNAVRRGNTIKSQIKFQSPGRNKQQQRHCRKDDPAELGKIITLPIMPEEAVWREESRGRQTDAIALRTTDRKLTAVLLYTPEETQKLIALFEKHKPAEAVELEIESWFPAELIAQSQTSGNETIKGNAYAANDFIQSPYLNGRITHISGTDYFVLELFTS